MKFFILMILGFLLKSCASLDSDFGSYNITEEQFNSIQDQDTYLSIHERLGTSLCRVENGNSLVLIYTNDVFSTFPEYEDISFFFVKDKDGIYALKQKERVKGQLNRRRCSPRKESSLTSLDTGDAESAPDVGTALVEYYEKEKQERKVKRKEENPFCYINNYGKQEGCYSSLESCEQQINLYGRGFCTWNR